METFSNRNTGEERENGISALANKASSSLKRNEAEILKNWLKVVIDDLGLLSLQSFPAQELSSVFPQLISCIARGINEPSEEISISAELEVFAARIATLNKEQPTATKVFDDYAALRHLFRETAATGLRSSDTEALRVFQRLDDGLMHFLKIGLEVFIKQHSLELQQLANTDALTDLFNMRYFRQKLHENLETYKRYQLPFSLIMIDLDKLKLLNDEYGHQMGDIALKHLAKMMKEEKREIDVAARYGGDEFFLLLPGTATEAAKSLANRISNRVKRINLNTGGREMTSVSIGVVSCPLNGDDVGTLRSKADQALYLAKKVGGGAVACYRDGNS